MTLLSGCWAYMGRVELLLVYTAVLLEATVIAVVLKLSASCNTAKPVCYCSLPVTGCITKQLAWAI